MRLQHWSRAFRDVDFEPKTGRARLLRLSEARSHKAPLAGFAWPERSLVGKKHWFALFRSDDSIVFQTGSNRWIAGDPRVRFTHFRPSPLTSRFEVSVEDSTVFSILYSNVGRVLFALIDPTYDGLDQESDFFLEFVAEHANSAHWSSYVLERWRDSAA